MGKKISVNKNKEASNGGSKLKAVLLFCMTATLLLTVYSLKKTIVININGEEKTIVTFKGTVSGILKDNDIEISENQIVKPDLTDKILEDDEIFIKDKMNVKIVIDGETKEVATAEEVISDVLKQEELEVDDDDEVTPSADTAVENEMEVKVVRIKYEEERTIEPINFETETKKDDSLESGKTKVISEGLKGEKEQLVKIKYADGEEVERKVVSETVIKDPKKEVVAKGSKIEGPTVPSRGDISAKRVINCQATAYLPTGNKTATGTVPRQGNDTVYGTIAVDPRVIPLGTKVYVDGYGFAVAEDTGGAVKGNIIDLFMTSHSAAISWGRRSVKVYIL